MTEHETASTPREPTEKMSMIDDLEKELSEIGLQDELFAVVLKDENTSVIGAGAAIILLPMSLVGQLTNRGTMNAELLASGLKTTIEKLRPHGPTALLAESLLSLATIARSYMSLEDRLRLALEAVAILNQLGARHRLSRAYITLGVVLKDGEMFYDALRAFQLADDVSTESGDEGVVSISHYHKAVVSRRLGLPVEALKLLDAAEATIPKTQSLPVRYRQQMASERMTNNLMLGNDAKVLQEIENWIGQQTEDSIADESWMPYFRRAQLRMRGGDLDQILDDCRLAAIKASRQILDFQSDRFRRRERHRLNFVFDASLWSALAASKWDLAFGLLQLSKTGGVALDPVEGDLGREDELGRTRLASELNRLVTDASNAVMRKAQDELMSCQERADWLLTQQDLLSVSRRPTAASQEYLTNFASRVRVNLPEGAALLEFASVPLDIRGDVSVGGQIWVFCLTRNVVMVRETELTLEKLLLLSESFSQECQGLFPTDALDALSCALLCPVRDVLSESKSLFIVPSIGLYGIPFHAMHLGGKALVESHDVSYLPRASTLLEVPKTRGTAPISRQSSWKGLGTPKIAYAKAVELKGVRNELTSVAAKFASPVCILDPPATSNDLFGTEHVDVLHVACHGDFDPVAPLLARLMFSDRPVFAFEIMASKLDVELVVLSACQTAEVKAALGGHVQSLASAFLAAGAKRVIASLWPVDDSVGAECVEQFYVSLVQNRSESTGASLRAAQRSIRSEAQNLHPYFWAPFALFSTERAGV